MSPRVLVIEDNALNLKLVRDVLQHAGYDVVEAATGELGVASAASEPPDLVLLDLQLPGIDGHETLRRLRAGVLPDRVPVVAVTAWRWPRTGTGRSAPASTATSRSRSVRAHCPRRWSASSPAVGRDGRDGVLRSTTSRRTCDCSTPCSRHAATRC